MAGAMKIYEMTAAAAGTDKTSGIVRFKLANNATVDNNNPLTIPSGTVGTRRSYTKQLRFYCATAPSVKIDNLRAYSDGANGFGTGVSVNYDTTGTFIANATAAMSPGTDIFTKTSGAPIDLDGINTASVNATGFAGDLLRLQMVVASTASSGALSAETITWAYDEI